jgi:soluble lytic murein transglycosylase-like protein
MTTLTALFITFSAQYQLPPNLLSSLCWVESKHKIQAVHHDDGGEDSLGVCQVKLSTAKWLGFKGTANQLMNPEVNIKYSAKYLSKQIHRYKGNIKKAVTAYNRGHSTKTGDSAYYRKVKTKWRMYE